MQGRLLRDPEALTESEKRAGVGRIVTISAKWLSVNKTVERVPH